LIVLATIEAQDAAVIIGACGALVVVILTPLLKMVVDIRRDSRETNQAVNNRPKDQPTIRDLVERLDIDLDILRRESSERHQANSRRIDRISVAVDAQTRKLDRLSDAVGGANRRLDHLEGSSERGDTRREQADVRREQADVRREQRERDD